MSRLVGVSLAAGCALFLAAGAASAQAPYLYDRPNYGVGYRPQLNPYLNLSNNNDPAVNYFLRTLPELDRRANKQIYGAVLGALEERTLNPAPAAAADVDLFTPLPSTGHPTAFDYTGSYFPGSRGVRPASGYTPPAGRR